MDIQIPVVEIVNAYKQMIAQLAQEKTELLERALLAETQVRVMHSLLQAQPGPDAEAPQEA